MVTKAILKRVISGMLSALIVISVLFSAFIIQPVECSAPPSMNWSKTYGGTGEDWARSVIQTNDEGYIVAGYTKSYGSGGKDFLLVKFDMSGKFQWRMTYGGGSDDEAYSVIQASDGGYAIAGYTRSKGSGGADFWLVKTDIGGKMLLDKTYGGTADDIAHSIIQTSDGGFAMTGETCSFGVVLNAFYFIKTDASGNAQVSKTYESQYGNGWENAWSVLQTTDGGYSLSGRAGPYPFYFWLIKTDASGNKLWDKMYALGGDSMDDGPYAVQTKDGGYALAGSRCNEMGPNFDPFLLKLDSAGNKQWAKDLIFPVEGFYYIHSVAPTSDGGYIVAGGTSSLGAGGNDFWLIKTDSSGTKLWENTYGGGSNDEAFSVIQTLDGGYAFAGYTKSYGSGSADFWLIETASDQPANDLSITNMDVVQVVWHANAVTLNKDTSVRVDVLSTFSTDVTVTSIDVTYNFGASYNGQPYKERGESLRGVVIKRGINRIYIPGGPILNKQSGSWTITKNPCVPPQGNSFFFKWTTTGTDSNIKAKISPVAGESNVNNNERTMSKKVIDTSSLSMAYYKVEPLWPANYGTPTLAEYSDTLSNNVAFMKTSYPIEDSRMSGTDKGVYNGDPVSGFGLWDDLQSISFYAWLAGASRGIGIVSDAYFPFHGESASTHGYMRTDILGAALVQEGFWTAAAHEIGHTYGAWLEGGSQNEEYIVHPPGNEAYGFSVHERKQKANGVCFMGFSSTIGNGKHTFDYSTTRPIWPCYECFNILLNEFEDPSTLVTATESAGGVLFVRGGACRNGTVYLRDLIVQPSAPIMSPEPGNYTFRLVDSEGQITSEAAFTASFESKGDPNGTIETDVAPFSFSLPWGENASQIEITYQGSIVLQQPITSHTPSVQVITPNGGETVTAESNYTVTWNASDLDGDALTYVLEYSSDDGQSWSPIAVDLSQTSYIWDTRNLKPGNSYMFKVIATDGVNTGQDTSDGSFTVPDITPPSIVVKSPLNKVYYSDSVALSLETDEPTSWIGYSIDNEPNTTMVDSTIISVEDGQHQIVFFANDTAGNMGRSQVVAFVVDSSAYDTWSSDFIGLRGYPMVDLCEYNGKLYGASDSTLYVYDGNSWNSIDAPTYITSVLACNDTLLVGGRGGLYAFDGTFFSLILPVSTYVKILGVYDGNLYAGTFLDNPPTLYYCNGSIYNPDDWHIDGAFSELMSFTDPFGSIDSFAEYDGNLYVTSGGTVYCYNETGWSISKTYEDVYAFSALQVYDGSLCLGTRDQGWRKPMYLGGSGFSGRVIEFDGENWTTILDHDYWIYSLETYGNKLYVGTANKILTYNGTDWNTSFDALEEAYYAMSVTVLDNKIYAGMGNGYIFTDPVYQIPISPPPLPIAAVSEYSSIAFTLLLIISSLSVFALTKRRLRRKFKMTS